MSNIPVENLNCPHCNKPHSDKDEWALRAHKTHLCEHCSKTFEGTIKAVSHPTFTKEPSKKKPRRMSPKALLDSIHERTLRGEPPIAGFPSQSKQDDQNC